MSKITTTTTTTIKSFLKDKIDSSYTLDELKDLSEEYSKLNSSDKIIDSKKSLVLLCKYVKIVDGKIIFDITNSKHNSIIIFRFWNF